jgi:hypothetical protein
MLASVMMILNTSATKESYSTTGKACNLIPLTELHFIFFYKVTKRFQIYFSINGYDLPLLDS